MKYKIVMKKSEEGYSVSCPGLPGCWSQGESEEEAIREKVTVPFSIPHYAKQYNRSASNGMFSGTPSQWTGLAHVRLGRAIRVGYQESRCELRQA